MGEWAISSTAEDQTSETRLTAGLLDRRAICLIKVAHFSRPPIFRVDLGVEGQSLWMSVCSNRPDVSTIKKYYGFSICCSIWK